VRKGEVGSGSYAVPLKPRTYIAIRSNHIQSVYNQCTIRVQSERSPNPHPPSQCPISVQSVYNLIQSVYNQCTISVQSVNVSQSTPTIEAETRQLP